LLYLLCQFLCKVVKPNYLSSIILNYFYQNLITLVRVGEKYLIHKNLRYINAVKNKLEYYYTNYQTNNIMKTNLNDLELNELQAFTLDAIDKLNDLKGSDIEASELHNQMYNIDYFIIGRYNAEQWLIKNGGVFNAIGAIQEYEKDNFGEVSTDLSEAEKVCNMFAYILGEELLSESEALQILWDKTLIEEDFDTIISELKEFASL